VGHLRCSSARSRDQSRHGRDGGALLDGAVGEKRDADRQEGPHAHQILTDLDSRHVFGVDLGADKIVLWNLDLATGKLVANAPAAVSVARGSGRRRFDFVFAVALTRTVLWLGRERFMFAKGPTGRCERGLATRDQGLKLPLPPSRIRPPSIGVAPVRLP